MEQEKMEIKKILQKYGFTESINKLIDVYSEVWDKSKEESKKEQNKLFIEYLDNLINYIDTKHPQISMIRGSVWSMKEKLSNN